MKIKFLLLIVLSVIININAQTTIDNESKNGTSPGDSLGFVPINNNAAMPTSSDVDFFKINVHKVGVLTIAVTGTNSNMQTKVQLYNASNVSEGFRTASVASTDVTMEILLQTTGVFIIKIQNTKFSNSSSPYNLSIALDTSDESEFNNAAGLATTIPTVSFDENNPTKIKAKIKGYYYVSNGGQYDYPNLASDFEFFKVNLPKKGVLNLDVSNVPSNIKFRIELLNSGLGSEGSRDAIFDGDSVRFEFLTQYAGIYYIRLTNRTAKNTSNTLYSFNLSLDTSGNEFNNTMANAAIVPSISFNEKQPTTISGKIRGHYYGGSSGFYDFGDLTPDFDYYKVNLSKKGVLIMNVTNAAPNLKFKLEVFNGSGVSEGYRVANFDGDTLHFELLNQSTGTYYVKLSNVTLKNTSSLPYKLDLSLDTLGYEFNNAPGLAKNIIKGQPLQGNIRGYYKKTSAAAGDFASLSVDNDYYKINSQCNNFQNISITNVPVDLMIKLTAFDSTGSTMLGSKIASFAGANVVLNASDLTNPQNVRFFSVENVAGVNGSNTSESLYTINASYTPVFQSPKIIPGGVITACKNSVIQLRSSAVLNNKWSTGENSQTINYLLTSETPVTLQQDSGNCYSEKDSVKFTMNQKPVVDFNFSVNNKTLQTINLSSNATSFLWKFGDGKTSILSNPTNIYDAGGNYQVTLIATNQCGSDTVVKSITVSSVSVNEHLDERKIVVFPNPTNGVFNIMLPDMGPTKSKLCIYDSRGALVYLSDLDSNEKYVTIKSNLAIGIYNLVVFSETGNHTLRLVVINN
ncbi:MAG: PKD domain-containing protein [Bacteroidota bacterium]